MERRWGERNALNLTVLIRRRAGSPVGGTLRNVSSSGAYLQTTASLPLLSPVHLHARVGAGTQHAWGRLVRRDEHGYGLEWDPECRAVDAIRVRTAIDH